MIFINFVSLSITLMLVHLAPSTWLVWMLKSLTISCIFQFLLLLVTDVCTTLALLGSLFYGTIPNEFVSRPGHIDAFVIYLGQLTACTDQTRNCRVDPGGLNPCTFPQKDKVSFCWRIFETGYCAKAK